MTQVTVIVKALNEEQRIGACLRAALLALQGLDAEVLVVDSVSTDRTVALARAYPVRIVQFDEPAQRGCGAAVELGWRHARGDFIYVLDADMLLQPGFVQQALAWLQAHPRVAAVGGNLVDTHLRTQADRQRARIAAGLLAPREVDELGGGGLYRRSAIAQAGYLAHLSLAAYEEAELGVRLRALGWALVRLPQTAVLHEGHAETNRQMLARLWANGRAQSGAVFLKSAWGKPWFARVLRKLWHILAVPLAHAVALGLAAAGAWRALAGGGADACADAGAGACADAGAGALAGAGAGAAGDALVAGLAAWAGFWLLLLGALALRRGSLRQAVWQLVLWHYWAAGTLAGMGQRVGDPRGPIPAHELGAGAGAAP